MCYNKDAWDHVNIEEEEIGVFRKKNRLPREMKVELGVERWIGIYQTEGKVKAASSIYLHKQRYRCYTFMEYL